MTEKRRGQGQGQGQGGAEERRGEWHRKMKGDTEKNGMKEVDRGEKG